jgi:hypothetical protein
MAHDPHVGFTGLDLRKLADASDPRSARKAENVDLTIAGGYRSRDPFVAIATVDAKAVGLYALGGQLRCVVPGGEALSPPPGIIYDRIGNGGASYGTSIAAVTAQETIGTDVAVGIKPYLVIQRADGTYEHHWIQKPPYPVSTTVNTRVVLPFRPGAHLIKMAQKLWATDTFDNAVRYSSVVNGPTDWTLPDDAGELPIGGHVSGNRVVTGLGQIESKLAVYLDDAVEIWRVFADPTRSDFGIDKVMDGPGTQAPRSIVNVLGDLFYFSRGGFRSLKQNLLTGQFREGDIGARIQSLTKNIDPTASGAMPVALWSQARQQYLCAIGNTVYALTYSMEKDKVVDGWTTWVLPAAVEYMTELDGEVYFRAGTTIYQAIRGGAGALEAGYNWDLRFQFGSQGETHTAKTYNFLEVIQAGSSTVNFYDDPRNPDVPIDSEGLATSDQDRGYIPLGMTAESLSLGFTGTESWQLEQWDLYYDRAGV